MQRDETLKLDIVDKAKLVTLIGKGITEAEQELVSLYWHGIFFLLNKRTGDSALAADLTQDTFIVVIKHARQGTIKNPQAIGCYIRRVGINLMIAHFRKQQRHHTDNDDQIDIHIPSQLPPFSHALHAEQLVELMQTQLNLMTVQRDKDILYQFYVLQLDKLDICAALDLSPNHFDRVVFRARARLKQQIINSINDDDCQERGTILLQLALVTMLSPLVSSVTPTKIPQWVGEIPSLSHCNDISAAKFCVIKSRGATS